MCTAYPPNTDLHLLRRRHGASLFGGRISRPLVGASRNVDEDAPALQRNGVVTNSLPAVRDAETVSHVELPVMLWTHQNAPIPVDLNLAWGGSTS